MNLSRFSMPLSFLSKDNFTDISYKALSRDILKYVKYYSKPSYKVNYLHVLIARALLNYLFYIAHLPNINPIPARGGADLPYQT